MVPAAGRRLPECWGHRGASARFPENTLASFEAAIRDGAEGLESDVHISTDDVIIMFHDPTLDRTTDGTGAIKDQVYYGYKGMQYCRTLKEPKQPIPTFAETVALLMQPENMHVKFNIDVKVNSEPTRLFTLMRETLTSVPNWETALAPRLLVGLWHPAFLAPCTEFLPHCRRSYIGLDVSIARKHFWECDAFSVNFNELTTPSGQAFIKEAKAANKQLCVWTVNKPDWMLEAVRWEVDAILTDVTQVWIDLREALKANYDLEMSRQSRMFLWTEPRMWAPFTLARHSLMRGYIESIRGPFDPDSIPKFRPLRVAHNYWRRALFAYGLLVLRILPPKA